MFDFSLVAQAERESRQHPSHQEDHWQGQHRLALQALAHFQLSCAPQDLLTACEKLQQSCRSAQLRTEAYGWLAYCLIVAGEPVLGFRYLRAAREREPGHPLLLVLQQSLQHFSGKA